MSRLHLLAVPLFLLALSVIAASAANAQGVHLHAVLVGGNEIGGGDPNGFGTASVQFNGSEVCVGIVVSKIDSPTAAHIHDGFAPQSGPIVVPLPTPNAGNSGGSVGCVEIDAALASDIKKNPSQFYVNVHTKNFPGGSIRGQLF